MGNESESRSDRLSELTTLLRDFADQRDWQQFHTPRNLCLALVGEVGELSSEFQWLTDHEADSARVEGELRSRVQDELADVAIYLMRLADVLEVDLADVVRRKVDSNAQRYTISRSRGNAYKQ